MLRKISFLVAVALAVVLADQAVKYRVVGELTSRFEGAATLSARLHAFYSQPPAPDLEGMYFHPVRVITVTDNLKIRYAENPGAAWGLFRTLPERIRGPLFHVVSLGAVILISMFFLRLSGARQERWAWFGLPLVLGGAIGNYVDRLTRGFVVDFIEAYLNTKSGPLAWPSFNVADAAICVGIAMIVIDGFVRKELKTATAASQP